MQKIIDISNYKENLLMLERASWEKECREELLAFLVNQGLTQSDDYTRLWEEYLIAYANYQKEKDNFYQTVVINFLNENYKIWEVQYNEEVLILN